MKKNEANKKLTANMEDYLEVIADLQKKNGIARVRDIGAQMKVKNSSVNAALNSLTESGYAVHEKYGYVELTNKGKKIASAVKKKHDLLFKFLVFNLHRCIICLTLIVSVKIKYMKLYL
ncbi:MAG TPA: metal-dependent transcriptional regulator [bacterium]|nr:metal-dependent transcriptional regulator [bacterium]